MNTNTKKLEALAIALDYAGLSYEEVNVETLKINGDELGISYEIEFASDCLRYYSYVDAHDGEVLGFLAVPNDVRVKMSCAA